jgi:sulfhydrogenase subunit beta (sulfur reductase)
MDQRFTTDHDLIEFLEFIGTRFSIFTPQEKEGTLHYSRYSRRAPVEDGEPGVFEERINLGEIRTCEPLKVFLFEARKRVSTGYQHADSTETERPRCIVGVKACDLKSLKILDGVFIDEDFTDPFYAVSRRENLILSSDCTAAADTCFCTSLHVDPFPRDGFDLNLSVIDGGYVVEIGSDKGREIVESQQSLFTPATDKQLSERGRRRERVSEQVKTNVREYGMPDQDAFDGIIKTNYESDFWREEGAKCVECGACNAVCPTCHCFLLCDQERGGSQERFRLWDSCLIKDFAQVAGGANPRPELWMRLRNRFEKKFDFFPTVKEIYACTGCGRCITACPGNIDIRDVLKRNVESVPVR